MYADLQPALFRIVTNAQSSFVADQDLPETCVDLLGSLLDLTDAGYGFLGAVDSAHLDHLSILASVRRRAGRAAQVSRVACELPVRSDSLIAVALAARRPRVRTGPDGIIVQSLPSGSPPLANVLVLPFPLDGPPRGVMFLANRRGGWTNEVVHELRPAADTCATLFTTDGARRQLIRREDELMQEREQEQAEAQLARTEFVSVVSHELRTPLTSIRGALGLLTAGAAGPTLSAEQQELLQLASTNTDRLIRLVNEILTLDSITGTGQPLRREVMRIEEPVGSSVDAAHEALTASRIEVQLAFEPGVEVYGDRARLVQVLTNLLDNAIKFSEPGSSISIEAEQGDVGTLIGVRDQGIGLGEDDPERAFEPFWQGDSSDTRSRGGTGLGLAICRSIVTQHGGWIRVTSSPGRGSFFQFLLPAPSPSPQEPSP